MQLQQNKSDSVNNQTELASANTSAEQKPTQIQAKTPVKPAAVAAPVRKLSPSKSESKPKPQIPVKSSKTKPDSDSEEESSDSSSNSDSSSDGSSSSSGSGSESDSSFSEEEEKEDKKSKLLALKNKLLEAKKLKENEKELQLKLLAARRLKEKQRAKEKQQRERERQEKDKNRGVSENGGSASAGQKEERKVQKQISEKSKSIKKVVQVRSSTEKRVSEGGAVVVKKTLGVKKQIGVKSVQKQTQSSATMQAGDLNFHSKEHLIEEFSCRFWFALPPWPPMNYDYSPHLLSIGLRRVDAKDWKREPEERDGLRKVLELDSYTGYFKDSQGKSYDLRPKESCPSLNNFERMETRKLQQLLLKAYEEQLQQLNVQAQLRKEYDAKHERALVVELQKKIHKLGNIVRNQGH